MFVAYHVRLSKPNVWADFSAQNLLLYPRALSEVLRNWMEYYPEKILFGTDASPFYGEIGWEETGWMAVTTTRTALALALTGMIEDGEITRERAIELAGLVLRENAASLPGVVVEQDYRRRYPLSGEVQSLSHMLGYIGRVNECDLVRGNPARSWMMSLLESISHATECGVVQKQINPTSLGSARYLNDDRIGKDGRKIVARSPRQGLRGAKHKDDRQAVVRGHASVARRLLVAA